MFINEQQRKRMFDTRPQPTSAIRRSEHFLCGCQKYFHGNFNWGSTSAVEYRRDYEGALIVEEEWGGRMQEPDGQVKWIQNQLGTRYRSFSRFLFTILFSSANNFFLNELSSDTFYKISLHRYCIYHEKSVNHPSPLFLIYPTVNTHVWLWSRGR